MVYLSYKKGTAVTSGRKEQAMSRKIITIARQYGSGGRETGHALAEMCGYKFYDNNLISLAASKIGFDEGRLHAADEKIPNSILYTLAAGSSMYGNVFNQDYQPINDKLFMAQSEIIEAAAEEDHGAVIVGRCADYVLEHRTDVLRVFLYADFDHRVAEIARRHELSESEAKSLVIKTDRRRANYYNYYTGKKWGKLENYDLALSTDGLSIKEAAEYIASLAKIK